LIRLDKILITSLLGIILYILDFNNKIICIRFFLVTNLLMLDTVFDTLLENNFTVAPKSEINKITKNKLPIVKAFIKFFYILKR
jgi:hypothetical protein